jgi:hypothetical protein
LARLREEHDPQLGIDGLPAPANAKAWDVGFLYESLGIMIAFGLVDRRIILSVGNYRIRQAWETLAPYIEAERRIRAASFFTFFENAYVEACETNPIDVHNTLKLRTVESLATPPRPPVGPADPQRQQPPDTDGCKRDMSQRDLRSWRGGVGNCGRRRLRCCIRRRVLCRTGFDEVPMSDPSAIY